MENLTTIITLAGIATGLVSGLITFLLKFVKNAKARKALQSVLKITDILTPYIKKAETFANFTGEEKKAYVMTKANQYAIECGIDFDVEAISNKVEELIELTNNVNCEKNVEIKGDTIHEFD